MGAILSMLAESFPPKAKYSVNDIPNLAGKVIIVTGANTGIGKETAKALLEHNAKVYMAGRSPEKTLEAIKDLKEKTGKEGIFLHLDLADLPSIKAAAEEFQQKENQLHVLFNNAGVMAPPVKLVTAQGYDLQFGTNVLGHFYFTKLLLPTLLRTAESSAKGDVRVINTSSASHWMGKLDFNTFKDGPARRKVDGQSLYGQSKFGNIIFSNEFARRYGDKGIVSVSLNPGNLNSDLIRHNPGFYKKFSFLLHPVPLGALTPLWAGTSSEGADFNGKYLIPWARQGTAKKDTNDPELGKQLWIWLEEQVENL